MAIFSYLKDFVFPLAFHIAVMYSIYENGYIFYVWGDCYDNL